MPNYKVFKSEEWIRAEILAKKTSRAWKKAGKPRNCENEFFSAKKESNIKLRYAIKSHNNETSTKENNKLMNANFRDPKLLSQLVDKKRINKSGYTAVIQVDEQEFCGDAQVLAGFLKYHNEKSNPPEVFKSDDNHSYYYSTIDVDALTFIVQQ